MKIFVVCILLLFTVTCSTNSDRAPLPKTTFVTAKNVARARAVLIEQVFGTDQFPTEASTATGAGKYYEWPYTTLSDGGRFFDLAGSRLLIFHAGHGQDALEPDSGGLLVQRALSSGWDVLVLNMPPGDHSRFASEEYPLANFMLPIATALNYVSQNHDFDEVVMAGLSGGGWSTVLYSAMDPRITKSAPVAGGWPKYLRFAEGNPASIGDYEQQLPGLDFKYLDLYALATAEGREQVQIFNSDDPCCFSGNSSLDYLEYMQDVASALGGTFDVLVESNAQHSVPTNSFSAILGSGSHMSSEGPVTAAWDLDDQVGSRVMYESGNHFNGIFYNAPALGAGSLVKGDGTSVAFDGATQYAMVPDNPALRPMQKEYAIEMWAKFEGANYGMAFGKFADPAPYAGPTVFFNYADEVETPGRIEFREKQKVGYRVDTASTALNDSERRYYVFQRRQVAAGIWKLQIYVNGILDAETVLPSVEDLDTNQPIYLFSRPDSGQYVHGTFDEVKYHVGKSLSSDEILTNYLAQRG